MTLLEHVKVNENSVKELKKKINILTDRVDKLNKKITIQRTSENKKISSDKCYKSINRLWYNNYNGFNFKELDNKFEGEINPLKYVNEEGRIIDFYNILHNCDPFSKSLVAGVAISGKPNILITDIDSTTPSRNISNILNIE